MISDRDQQIRMLFLTQQVELASHGCVRQEIARVKQKSHCYQNARGTRDHTCQIKKLHFSEYAVRHEIARVKSQLNSRIIFRINSHIFLIGLTIDGKHVWQQEEEQKEDFSTALIFQE